MNRVVSSMLLLVWAGCLIACSGAGGNRPTVPTAGSHAVVEDEAAAEEARARWLADARGAKKAELEQLATATEGKAQAARQAYLKAYRAGLAFAKQQVLKKEAESLEADAKKARDEVASADTYEPPPPADDHPVAAIGHTGGGNTVHVQGYRRKDGTYVPPHTRSAPRR